MKGKKEFTILIILILALGTYLYFKRTDQLHYAIPQIGSVDAKKITRIEITAKDETVCLSKKDNAWYIDPKGYPADSSKVDKMLNVIAGLTLTDMVSESKNYARYELGDKERITVKAYSGSDLSRQFAVGKTAPSSSHTFVMLPKNAKVYQARDSFRDFFLLGATGLRDKKVLGFTQEEISKISISKGARVVTLTRMEPPGKPDEKDTRSPAQGRGWFDAAGKETPKPDADAVISSLVDLECEEYIDVAKDSLGSPELTVTLTGPKDYTISLYAKQEGKTPATSSGNAYVFTLPDYRQENIQKSAEKFLNKS